jgi:hypothetical protein
MRWRQARPPGPAGTDPALALTPLMATGQDASTRFPAGPGLHETEIVQPCVNPACGAGLSRGGQAARLAASNLWYPAGRPIRRGTVSRRRPGSSGSNAPSSRSVRWPSRRTLRAGRQLGQAVRSLHRAAAGEAGPGVGQPDARPPGEVPAGRRACPARYRARQRGPGGPAIPVSGPRSCGEVAAALPLLFRASELPGIGFLAGSSPATVVSALRTVISCGTLAEAGRQRVDGIEAIELTSTRKSLISETIWVSSGTYLPVRVVLRPFPGTPGTGQTADITWLKPAEQNLAKLTVPIPARFRQVPLAPHVGSVSP